MSVATPNVGEKMIEKTGGQIQTCATVIQHHHVDMVLQVDINIRTYQSIRAYVSKFGKSLTHTFAHVPFL